MTAGEALSGAQLRAVSFPLLQRWADPAVAPYDGLPLENDTASIGDFGVGASITVTDAQDGDEWWWTFETIEQILPGGIILVRTSRANFAYDEDTMCFTSSNGLQVCGSDDARLAVILNTECNDSVGNWTLGITENGIATAGWSFRILHSGITARMEMPLMIAPAIDDEFPVAEGGFGTFPYDHPGAAGREDVVRIIAEDEECPTLRFENADVEVTPSFLVGSGGHEHSGAEAFEASLLERIIESVRGGDAADLTHITGRTNNQGELELWFTASRVAADLDLTVTARGEVFRNPSDSAQATGVLSFGFEGLTPIAPGPGDHFVIVGQTPTHPVNNFVDPRIEGRLRAFANEARDATDTLLFDPIDTRLNDASLARGGLFDIAPDEDFDYSPTATSHKLHRLGIDVDVNVPDRPLWPAPSRADTKILYGPAASLHGAFLANEEPIHYRFPIGVGAALIGP